MNDTVDSSLYAHSRERLAYSKTIGAGIESSRTVYTEADIPALEAELAARVMNDFLKDEQDWERELRNAEGRLQRLCHCGERAHFGQPNNTWVCREHSRFAAAKSGKRAAMRPLAEAD
jgi:hypothetical protein